VLRLFSSGLHYKPITIVNDGSRVVSKLETSLTEDARVIIYDRHMFIVQATGQLCQPGDLNKDATVARWS
jgi:hypothetical protein